MSQLLLKILAVIAMTIDHVGLVFGQKGWRLMPNGSMIFRDIGRLSFPLFAFCFAQGWHRTRDRKRYFKNLSIGALVSQIPFSMAFSVSNLQTETVTDTSVYFLWPYLLFAATAGWGYSYFASHTLYDRNLILVAMTALLPGLRLKIGGFCFLAKDINVFYTFLIAYFCLFALEKRACFGKIERMGILLMTPILWIAYGLPADYGTGLLGILLILGFSILSSKWEQIGFLILWSVLFYGVILQNFIYALSCSLAGICIGLYAPSKKNRFRYKYFFYGYYPLHLLALGIFNWMKFQSVI